MNGYLYQNPTFPLNDEEQNKNNDDYPLNDNINNFIGKQVKAHLDETTLEGLLVSINDNNLIIKNDNNKSHYLIKTNKVCYLEFIDKIN